MVDLPDDLGALIQFDAKGAVASREGKRLEFKEDFIAGDLSDYTKVLASFANAGGGVIVFGVSNNPRTIVGASGMTDEANWANRLRDDFEPELAITVKEYKALGHILYAVGLGPCLHKPVICKRQ
jgi:predicted HTH transcriptional regulator